MTENFKAGDRVRMTKGNDKIETTLIEYAQGVCVELTSNINNALYLTNYTNNGWAVEKIQPPLPTTSGSVVKVAHSSYIVLDERGDWGNYNEAWDLDDIEEEHWELVFDAAKVEA